MWESLLNILVDEVGSDVAGRIELRLHRELGGLRLTIPKRAALTAERVQSISPGKPRQAAVALGVHPTTIYRALRRRPVR